MKQAAEEHAEEDKKRHDAAVVHNEAEAAVFGAEKLMNELGEKMSADEKGKVNSQLDDLKHAIEHNDTAGMKSGTDSLNKTIHEFTTRLYQQAGAQGGANPGGNFNNNSNNNSSSNNDNETVDAEFSDRG